jgi:prephenate dehydrogenase
MRSIAIIGVGLIGSSFALALRKAGFNGPIIGVSSERSIEAGIKAGAIDRGVTLEIAALDCDLIYLSQPIEQILVTLQLLGGLVKPGCLVTDAGSTKKMIAAKAAEHLPPASFLGGHPMAGKETRGAETADADLFRNRPYIITGFDSTNPQTVDFRCWLHAIGTDVIEMTPEQHDQTVALTSHLPQLLSTALAATLASEQSHAVSTIFGPALIDMTRLALSPADVWMSVLETNSNAIKKALDAFEKTLMRLRDNLECGEVAHVFEEGRRFASKIRTLP